jgi:hypothetical protein
MIGPLCFSLVLWSKWVRGDSGISSTRYMLTDITSRQALYRSQVQRQNRLYFRVSVHRLWYLREEVSADLEYYA